MEANTWIKKATMEKKLSFIECDIIIINNRNIVQLFLYVYLVHFLLLFCHKGRGDFRRWFIYFGSCIFTLHKSGNPGTWVSASLPHSHFVSKCAFLIELTADKWYNMHLNGPMDRNVLESSPTQRSTLGYPAIMIVGSTII